MEDFLPFLIMILVYTGVIYLKKLNPLYSIILLGCAIVCMLAATIVTREKIYLGLLMSLIGLVALIKKIKDRNSNLNTGHM